MSAQSPNDRVELPPRVVIVGGGPGGIMCAIALGIQLNFDNYTIYEKADDFGGSWRDNTYPGCACDTPAHWYSFSTELHPAWSTTMAPQPELLAYWKSIADKHGLTAHTTFHTRVLSASWIPSRSCWEIELQDVRTGVTSTTNATAIISAAGLLDEPSFPSIPGLDKFKGIQFHSARWDHSVDFSNKRVAVIGNSASAAQFVPRLVKDTTTHVVQFCRTPNWFVYGPSPDYSPLLRWILAHIPLALRLFRTWVFIDLVAYIHRTAPPKYHKQLVPSYPFSCRRPIFDPGYLTCLHLPNVELNWDGISEIVEEGIRTRQGEVLKFDIMVAATGFITGRYTFAINGDHGQSLEDHSAKQPETGGVPVPSAYLGINVPGFPNLFFIGGPNTVTSNGSAVFTHEVEVDYIMQLLRPLLRQPARSCDRARAIEARQDAYEKWNAQLRAAMTSNSYTTCPSSWFRVNGRNFTLFPWSVVSFWWLMRRVQWQDYIVA
ncbi:FAD/NAD(P)-binding domain-containing protein [Wolfiporia cocos MD-104 SS10]|uniref:FAD/NAD(P)-binding domain-containing protein n=1 Tax=Wolfiporia cocos (strain MD-104) TaxID=742152 RepID=A0A2H3JI60_WOLCO|nr:FAD/NAD(P)-binding domain-containing protein [Wolfiporia cocos MD-104 SS10]